MSLITCGLADILVFADVIPFDSDPIQIKFVEDVIDEVFDTATASVDFDTDIQVIEFDIDIIKTTGF